MMFFIGFTIGFCLYFWLSFLFTKPPNIHVERLKNSLLAFALLKTRPEDIDEYDMYYEFFDGTKLPMFSGCGVGNACYSYILDKNEYKKNRFSSTSTIIHKINAIEKYLDHHFDDSNKTYVFFDDFIQGLRK